MTFSANQYVKPGQEGLYLVKPSTSIILADEGEPGQVWATAGQYVELDSTLSAYVQRTGQFGRLEPIETLPTGQTAITVATAPTGLRVGAAIAEALAKDDVKGQSWAEYEFHVYIGQSNERGQDTTSEVFPFGTDGPDQRLMELSHTAVLGSTTFGFRPAPDGELHVMRAAGVDNRGATTLCPAQSFGKQRLKDNPGIKQIVILCVSVGGSGFDVGSAALSWNPGSTLYNDAQGKALAFLLANPRHVFCTMVSGLGASEDASRSQSQIVQDYITFADTFRNSLPGGDRAVVLIPEIPSRPQSDNLIRSRAAHREIATKLDRCRIVPGADLDTPVDDEIHYKGDNLREIGRRTGEVSSEELNLLSAETPHAYRLQYDPDKAAIVDTFSGLELIRSPVIEDDPQRGKVLRINRLGVDTELTVNPTAYTVTFWCKRMTLPSAASPPDTSDFFIGGKIESQLVGFVLTRGTMGHVEPATATPVNLGFGAVDVVQNQSDVWFHMAISFANGTFTGYVNGVETTPINDGGGTYPAIDGPRAIQIGCQGSLGDGSSSGTGVMDARFDDIRFYPYALSAASVASLHTSTTK